MTRLQKNPRLLTQQCHGTDCWHRPSLSSDLKPSSHAISHGPGQAEKV